MVSNNKTFTIPPLVEVFWWDHYSLGDNWYDPGHPHKPCILSAVGYIVDENEYYYWISSTFEIASGQYSSGTAVLKNCVTVMNTVTPSRTINWDGTEHKTTTTKKRRTT